MTLDVTLRGTLRFHDRVAMDSALALLSRLAVGELSIFEGGFGRVGLLLHVDWEGVATRQLYGEGLEMVSSIAALALSGRVSCACHGGVVDASVIEAGGSRGALPLAPLAAPRIATDDVERVAFAIRGVEGYTLRGVSRKSEVLGGLLWEALHRRLLGVDEAGAHFGLLAAAGSHTAQEFVDLLREFAPERPGLDRHFLPLGGGWSGDLEALLMPSLGDASRLLDALDELDGPLAEGLAWSLARHGVGRAVDLCDGICRDWIASAGPDAARFEGHDRVMGDLGGGAPSEPAGLTRGEALEALAAGPGELEAKRLVALILSGGGQEAERGLSRAIKGAPVTTRAAVAHGLLKTKDTRGVDLLVELLGDRSGQVRQLAAQAIREAPPALRDAALAAALASGGAARLREVRALQAAIGA